MLRLLVLSLVLANGVYFAWTSGVLRAYGFAPAQQTEPQRMAQQIRPETVRVLTREEFARVEALAKADMTPKECLQAGPFSDAQADVLRHALEQAWMPDAWQLNTVREPARWIVYMGKYASAQLRDKKRNELQALKIDAEVVSDPALGLGLQLGEFETLASANTELARLGGRGIRTARVVQVHEEQQVIQLKLPAVSEAMKSRLADLKPALAGKSLKKCNGNAP